MDDVLDFALDSKIVPLVETGPDFEESPKEPSAGSGSLTH